MHSPLPNRKRDFRTFGSPKSSSLPPRREDLEMTFVEHFSSPVIEVVIGKNKTKFNVHKSLAMEKSALFRDYFPKRANANSPTFPLGIVEDGRHFEPFIFWMYNAHGNVLDTGAKPPYHFGELWTLAEEIESNEYRNFLADTIQRLPADPEWYVKSYDELVSTGRGGSVMGKFLIECLAYSAATQGWEHLIGNDVASAEAAKWFGSRKQLLHHLLLSVNETKNSEDPRQRYDCALHLHDSEAEREECLRYGKVELDDSTKPAKSEDPKNEEDRGEKRARFDPGDGTHAIA
ncbi:hypothetical protein LTR84_006475 [Exophiala bonariae]|uniref:BTB domain-containing protein n=1 Tax=Exophiala bonariae TaxID=1690606 RepID=A0AAV9N4U0_9EURO|nr:hypothetical protein LTR84_006475 [Exophiala bonariae]